MWDIEIWSEDIMPMGNDLLSPSFLVLYPHFLTPFANVKSYVGERICRSLIQHGGKKVYAIDIRKNNNSLIDDNIQSSNNDNNIGDHTSGSSVEYIVGDITDDAVIANILKVFLIYMIDEWILKKDTEEMIYI